MLKSLNCLLLMLVSFAVSLPSYAAEKLTFDPKHSYVLWRAEHFGFSTQTGKWYVNGTATIDRAKPQNSKVEATIEIKNIVTGLTDLDKHLTDKLFFDAEHYPIATFKSSSVAVTSAKSANVQGILTLHGVSKPVTLTVILNKTAMNPVTNLMTTGFTATTKLKRSDFGMNAFLPHVSDEVGIEIGVEAYQAQVMAK